jgi:hypothetical protein
MSLMGVVIVKVGHAIARVLKGIEIGATFGAGVTTLFVALLPAVRRGLLLRCVKAAATVGSWLPEHPKGHLSLHHGCSRLVGASSFRFFHSRRQENQKHRNEQIIV